MRYTNTYSAPSSVRFREQSLLLMAMDHSLPSFLHMAKTTEIVRECDSTFGPTSVYGEALT